MGKALMVSCEAQTFATSEKFNLIGQSNSTTEATHQYTTTEACTFSHMKAKIGSGNSGTATFRFRKNTANANQTFDITGTGSGEDTTNTDVFAAGDLMAINYTDTGSDSVADYVAGIVEFASGHGCFHGCSNTATVTIAGNGTTTYFAISGLLEANGTATIADAQWPISSYTSLEAFQIRVPANARTTQIAFRINVNGTAVGTAITFGAAVTGIQTVTGMGIALSPGDLVCIQAINGASAENLTASFMGVTFKSTSFTSEIWWGRIAGVARAASATENFYLPGGGSAAETVEATEQISLGFDAAVGRLKIMLNANTYGADAQLNLRVNGVSVLTTTITASGGAGKYESPAVVNVKAPDLLSVSIVGGSSGSITIQGYGFSVLPVNDGLAQQSGLANQSGVGGIGGILASGNYLQITQVPAP